MDPTWECVPRRFHRDLLLGASNIGGTVNDSNGIDRWLCGHESDEETAGAKAHLGEQPVSASAAKVKVTCEPS
jgi:hypothetical protein